MYDSITAADIPADAAGVAGYVEGSWKWTAADWARFPRARKVTIAVWAADAYALDVEKGDATPEMAPDWIRRQQARGLAVPSIYCNDSTWPAVQAACAGLSYDLWIAEYGRPGTPSYGRPHLAPGSAATQYADPAAGSGGHFDLSLCEDWWPRGVEMLDPNDPVVVDLRNKLGDLQYYIDPGPPGATTQGEITLRLRGLAPALDVAQLAAAVAADLGPQVPHMSPADLELVATTLLQRLGRAATAAAP